METEGQRRRRLSDERWSAKRGDGGWRKEETLKRARLFSLSRESRPEKARARRSLLPAGDWTLLYGGRWTDWRGRTPCKRAG